MKPVNFIDPTAIVPASAKVWHFARILRGAVLGEDTSVGSGAEIGFDCRIGRRTRISANVFLPPRSIIGNDTFIGPGVIFTDDKYPVANQPYTAQPPVVGDNVSIGAGAVILPGVKLDNGVRVGAGAVVTRSLSAGEVYVGIPARPLNAGSA